MRKFVAAVAVLGALAACGGGEGRPSTEEIAKALKDGGNAAGQAFAQGEMGERAVDCVAKALHDSDLSDEALNAIVEGDEDFKGSDSDNAALTGEELQAAVTACVTG